MARPTIQSRVRASLFCLAVTDALGGPLEFQSRRSDPSQHVTEMLPNRSFGLPAGHFTDDTSMALCLADSLIQHEGQTDILSQADNYVKWFSRGYMSSVPGLCFDVGNQTHEVLRRWEKAISSMKQADGIEKGDLVDTTMVAIKERFSRDYNCGNGSLMRVVPCALVARNEEQAVRLARESSDVTHPHPRNGDACIIYISLVFRALQGATKQDLVERLAQLVNSPESVRVDQVIKDRLRRYDSVDAFEQQPESRISSSGYVVDTLEAALWAFFTTNSYRDGAIKVVNLGDDADTVGAVYGGLAGAFYGSETDIPREWLQEMQSFELVSEIATSIVDKFHSG